MKRLMSLAALFLWLPLMANCSDNYGPMRGWGGHMMNYGYGYGYGGIFMWIIIPIAIGLLIYFFVQSQKTKGQTPTQNESHLDILKKRYAKGEISKEEYERMKKDLEG